MLFLKKTKRIISAALALIIAISVITIGSTSFAAATTGKTTLTTAVYNSDATITLGWSAASGANRYQIAKKKLYDSGYAYTEVTKTTYNDKNIVSGTIYYYQIRPVYVKGKSVSYGAWSSTKSVATLYKPTITSMIFYGDILNINWNKIKGALGYRLAFRRITDTTWNYRIITTNFYNVPNPTKGAVYVAQVRALHGSVASAWSSAKTVNPNIPQQPVITSIGPVAWYNDVFIVTWIAAGEAEKFTVYYKRKQDGAWSSVDTSIHNQIFGDLDANTLYYFQVRAFGKNSEASPYSTVKSYTTPAR